MSEQHVVSFYQSISRQVAVGVTAPTAVEAITRVRSAIIAGTVLNDTPALPLLRCDPFEPPLPDEGSALVLHAMRGGERFEVHESAVVLRRQRAALRAAQLLVLAYRRANQGGLEGSVDWSVVDLAFEAARVATGETQETPADASEHAQLRADHDPQLLAALALDEACAFIQRWLGVENGDLAGRFFSDDVVLEQFVRYIQSELGQAECADGTDLDAFDREVTGDALHRYQSLTVDLKSRGNPDMGQDPDRPLYGVPNRPRHAVYSLAEAGVACRTYVETHGLGYSQWAGGAVRDRDGGIVARVDYGGRIYQRRS